MINHIVPMKAAGSGFQDRRYVAGSDSKIGKVIDDLASLIKGECAVQLETVCGGRSCCWSVLYHCIATNTSADAGHSASFAHLLKSELPYSMGHEPLDSATPNTSAAHSNRRAEPRIHG